MISTFAQWLGLDAPSTRPGRPMSRTHLEMECLDRCATALADFERTSTFTGPQEKTRNEKISTPHIPYDDALKISWTHAERSHEMKIAACDRGAIDLVFGKKFTPFVTDFEVGSADAHAAEVQLPQPYTLTLGATFPTTTVPCSLGSTRC